MCVCVCVCIYIYLAATGNIKVFPVFLNSQIYENKNRTVTSDSDSTALTYTEMYFSTCEVQINA